MKEVLTKLSPIVIRLFAVIGVLAVLMMILYCSLPSPLKWLFSSHQDSFELFNRASRHKTEDMFDRMPPHMKHSNNADEDADAERLCNLYPKEEVCISWRAGIKCLQNDECAKEMEADDITEYADEEAVLACFVSKDEMLDDDTIANLPDNCRSFKLLDLEDLWGKDSSPSPFRKIDLQGNELMWSQKITLGHLTGVARGIKLIISENEAVKEDLAPAIPILESFEALEENGADKEMATGLLIGLYNSTVTAGETAKKHFSEENSTYCAGLKEKLVPVRCRILANNAASAQ